MKNVNIVEASKKTWSAKVADNTEYPGDTNIQLGCLQRIATATEAMAVYHVKMQEDYNYLKRNRDMYRKNYEMQVASNRALRGVITKLKKQLKQSNSQTE